jgi:hypothetical protein
VGTRRRVDTDQSHVAEFLQTAQQAAVGAAEVGDPRLRVGQMVRQETRRVREAGGIPSGRSRTGRGLRIGILRALAVVAVVLLLRVGGIRVHEAAARAAGDVMGSAQQVAFGHHCALVVQHVDLRFEANRAGAVRRLAHRTVLRGQPA